MSRSRHIDIEDLAESIPHIVWMSAPDGSTDYFNRHGSEYTGRPPEANYGWGWVQLVHPGDAMRARRTFEDAVRTTTPFALEYRIRRSDGQFRWHSFRAVPIQGRDGEVVGWIGTAIDIDDTIRLTERLRNIERQTADVLSLLGTLTAPPETVGHVERAIRVIRSNATLAEDIAPSRRVWSRSEPNTADSSALSAAEQAVVRLIAIGYTNREAANRLAVSLRTVETHRARAMQKLGLATRADLVRFAFDSGLADWH